MKGCIRCAVSTPAFGRQKVSAAVFHLWQSGTDRMGVNLLYNLF